MPAGNCVLNDFAKHRFDVQSFGLNLLGDKAGWGHSRSGVDLQQERPVVANDEIDPNYAIAVE